MLYRGSQQVDHADEGVIVSISSGSAFGCPKDAVERLDPGITVARRPASQDGVAMLPHCFQSLAHWLEQINIRNQP